MDWENKKDTWLCPCCKLHLQFNGDKRYENLDCHVSNPNARSHPLRSSYICINSECEVGKSKGFYGDEGDLYSGGLPEKYWSAIYSFSWCQDKKNEFEKTWIAKLLLLDARWVTCKFGIHSPIKRKFDDTFFCGECHKDLEGKVFYDFNPMKIKLRHP